MDRKLLKGALILALLLLSGCNSKVETGSILLGGDVILSRGGNALFTSKSQPWGLLEEYLRKEEDALFMVNLESPIGQLPKGLTYDRLKMNLCTTQDELRVLKAGGIDLVTQANNHAHDCQVRERTEVKGFFDKWSLENVGVGSAAQVVEWQGNTITIFALDDVSKGLKTSDYIEQIATARAKSDLVVISIHWGLEYQAGPTERQQQLAQELVDAGADLIWGHHSHVLQEMTWLTSRIDHHPALVIFSLGNLLTDQWQLTDTKLSTLVRVEFKDHRIKGIKLIPVRMKHSMRKLGFIWDQKTRSWITDRLKLEELERKGVKVNLRTH